MGLESGNGYLFGCFPSVLDLSIARNIRLGGSRTLQLRVDMFNAPNAAGITGRNTHLQLSSPADPVTPLNLPFDANGNVLPNRVQPNQAGFGAVNELSGAANDSGVHPVRLLSVRCAGVQRPSAQSLTREGRVPGLRHFASAQDTGAYSL